MMNDYLGREMPTRAVSGAVRFRVPVWVPDYDNNGLGTSSRSTRKRREMVIQIVESLYIRNSVSLH